jgi:hypothetical protein
MAEPAAQTVEAAVDALAKSPNPAAAANVLLNEAKSAAKANKPDAMTLVIAMAKSWCTQVPLGFGSGFLLAKQNIPGAVLVSMLTSLFVSMDILGRKKLEGSFWPVLFGMTTVLTLVSVVPWASTLKKPTSSGKQMSLPLGITAAAVICLLAAMIGNNKTTMSESLLGAIITLMYVLLSGSIGWHRAKATGPTAALHNGWALYSTIILLLLTLFDVISQAQ